MIGSQWVLIESASKLELDSSHKERYAEFIRLMFRYVHLSHELQLNSH